MVANALWSFKCPGHISGINASCVSVCSTSMHQVFQHVQQVKSITPTAGLLQPLAIPNHIWEDIAMDFITGLPCSRGFIVIFVVIDKLSKYGHSMPLKADFTSLKVVETSIHSVFKLHGLPKTISCDRVKAFTSSFWSHLFTKMGTAIHMTSAYHPQSDGQTEALNKCIEMYL